MIDLELVAAKTGPLSRSRVSVTWGPGLHSVVGAPADGGPQLLALVAGREPVRAGRLQVLGDAPRARAVAPQIAHVGALADLPDAMAVDEVLVLAARLRGETPLSASERLGPLGIDALARRSIRSLSREEARAVALAEALTSTRVRVLLVDEPLAGVDPRAASRVPEVLRAWAERGGVGLVATASVRDAGELCDDHVVLRQGTIAGTTRSLDALAAFTSRGARMRILASDPQALAVALAREGDVQAIARREGVLVARGTDASSLASAVGRAVVAAGVDVVEMRLEPPTLDDVRRSAASA